MRMVALGSGARANDPATQEPSVVGRAARGAQNRLTLLPLLRRYFLVSPLHSNGR